MVAHIVVGANPGRMVGIANRSVEVDDGVEIAIANPIIYRLPFGLALGLVVAVEDGAFIGCERRAVDFGAVSMHASDRYLVPGVSLDELRQSDGTLGYSPSLLHGVTGKGLNDYTAIFRILAKHGYAGWISIEDGMNGMGEMAESLAFLRKMIGTHFKGLR